LLTQHPATAAIPVFILSPKVTAAAREESRRLGIAGWIEKPLEAAVLVRAVSAAVRRAGGRRSVDRLTGIASRAAFTEAFARATGSGVPASVILLDLDALKAVNTAFGREAGDAVLRDVGARLAGAFRDTDVVARWRDDEFVVLLPATDGAAAKRLLARAQAILTTSPPVAPDGTELHVSFCGGIGQARPAMPLEDAIATADRALSAAKVKGPSTVLTDEEDRRSGPRQVLVAEDDRVAATLLRHRLERGGFHVVHCWNGQEALDAATAGVFELFVLDIRMPALDGFELLRRLRAMPAYTRTPIIMLTGLGREEDIVRAFDLGASDYVTKPFSAVELMARVYRLVRERAGAPS
jgi:putative two-component system response regulator